jgi:hypothetical protein
MQVGVNLWVVGSEIIVQCDSDKWCNSNEQDDISQSDTVVDQVLAAVSVQVTLEMSPGSGLDGLCAVEFFFIVGTKAECEGEECKVLWDNVV